jgi:hypothetical protein
MRSLVSFAILMTIKAVSRIFFRHRIEWVRPLPEAGWQRLRVVAILNHTSLYEPLLVGAAPNILVWKIARWGVLPVAAKTMRRKVGLFFRLIARNVVVVTRKRDHTWERVLETIDHRSVVCILPEGRMMRPGGLDAHGRPMTVRGGIADVLHEIPEGTMLLVYSGGLHHIQAPGEFLPRPFQTIQLRLEMVDIAEYRRRLLDEAGEEGFKTAVIRDLEARRNRHCPGYRPAIPEGSPALSESPARDSARLSA